MSVRAERKKHFALIVAAIILFMLAVSAGYAVGYGVNGEKREALAEENRTLASMGEQAEETLGKFAAMEKNAADLTAENEALKTENAALKEENERLKAQVEESEAAVNYVSLLEEGREDEAEETKQKADSSGFLDSFTRVVILIIIAVLVVMGLSMLFAGRRRRGRGDMYESYMEDYDEDDDDFDKTGEIYDEQSGDQDDVTIEETNDEPTRRIDIDKTYLAKATDETKEGEKESDLQVDAPTDVLEEEKSETEEEAAPLEPIKEVKVPDTLEELVGEEVSPVVPDSLEELMLRSIRQREASDEANNENT